MADAAKEEQRRWWTRRRRSSGDQETKCWEKRNKAHTYIGWGPFVPGRGFTRDKRGGLLSRVQPPPGTKGPFVPGRGSTRDKRCFLGGPGKFPARGPPLVPGGQKGPVFPHSRQILCLFLFLFYFSFKIGFHLLIQLIKLWNKISYLYINLIHATKIINFHSSDWVNEISNFFEIIFVIFTMQKYIR